MPVTATQAEYLAGEDERRSSTGHRYKLNLHWDDKITKMFGNVLKDDQWGIQLLTLF